jgi:O-antigen/teichoic acid export membrane protein
MITSTLWFFRDFLRAQTKFRISSKSPRNLLIAREYKEFPKISLPHSLMDLGRDLLVAVLLLKLFTKEDFGLYDHSYRMLRLPLVLAGMAIGQVFFQRCAEKINNNENIIPMIKKSVLTLTLLSIAPFAVIFFFGEELFAFVFGENWRGAGTFSEIMAPWFLVNFISSPISTLPMVLRKQKEFFKLAIVGSVLILGCLTIPPLLYNASIITTLWILSLTQACYLIFVIFKIFDYARNNN